MPEKVSPIRSAKKTAVVMAMTTEYGEMANGDKRGCKRARELKGREEEEEKDKTWEDRVHTLRLLPRCLPFLRCCMSTEKTHAHAKRATEASSHIHTKPRRRKESKGDRNGLIHSRREKWGTVEYKEKRVLGGGSTAERGRKKTEGGTENKSLIRH